MQDYEIHQQGKDKDGKDKYVFKPEGHVADGVVSALIRSCLHLHVPRSQPKLDDPPLPPLPRSQPKPTFAMDWTTRAMKKVRASNLCQPAGILPTSCHVSCYADQIGGGAADASSRCHQQQRQPSS